MGKSIRELFEKTNIREFAIQDGNPVATSGNTMQERYDIRNSKQIKLDTSHVLFKPAFWAVNNLRSNSTLTNRFRESLLEEETVGLRQLRTLSTPVLYGTNIIRLTTGTTPDIVDMRQSILVSTSDRSAINNLTKGALTNFLKKIDTVKNTVSRYLGIPFDPYPTKYTSDLSNTPSDKTMEKIIEIKSNSKGSVLGRFLSKTVDGTPEQISKQSIGTAISLAKDALKKGLFGSGASISSLISAEISSYSNQNKYSSLAFNNPSRESKRGSTEWDETYGTLSNDTVKGLDVNTLRPTFLKTTTKNNNNKDFFYSKSKKPTLYSSNIFDESLENKKGLSSKYDTINQTGRFEKTELNNKVKGVTDLHDVDLIPLRFQRVNDLSAIYMRSVITGFTETFTPGWEASNMVGNPFKFHNYTGIERSVSLTVKAYAMSQLELVMMWRRLEYLAHLTYPYDYTDSAIEPSLFYFTLGSLYVNKPAIITSLTYTINDAESLWEIGGVENKGKIKFGNYESSFNNVFWANRDNGNEGSLGKQGSGPKIKVDTTTNDVEESWKRYSLQYDVNSGNSIVTDDTDTMASSKTKNQYSLIKEDSTSLNMNHYKLPKFIDVQLEITFLENKNDTRYNVYGYGQSITNGVK